MKAIIAVAFLIAAPAAVADPKLGNDGLHMGYYEGQAILYPYGPVYCDKDGGTGSACYGVMIYTAQSAPLPPDMKHCRMADGINSWYQWEPRIPPLDQQKYIGQRICYLADRGKPRDLNSLGKD